MPTITFTLPISGTVITAGLHSANYSALQTLLNGGLDNANITAAAGIDLSKLAAAPWTAYTPAWTSGGTAPVIGNGTLAGRYVQIGKTVLFVASMTAGTTTTFGSANPWTISLPVTAQSITNVVGVVRATQPGVASYQGEFIATSTTAINLYTVSAASGAMTAWDSTHPFAWASTNIFVVQGSYEAA